MNFIWIVLGSALVIPTAAMVIIGLFMPAFLILLFPLFVYALLKKVFTYHG